MFTTLFYQELRHWRRQPLPYIFACCLLVLSFLTMWGMAAERTAGTHPEMLNSYYRINTMSNYFGLLLLLILPAIVGGGIHRDYKSRVFTLLYAYPITKKDYLLAKFASAFLVIVVVALMIGIGFALGTLMPGIDTGIMLPFNLNTYLQLYLFYLIPNLFLFSVLVFALVIWTRNVYVAFIGVLVLLIGQGIAGGVLQSMGFTWGAVLLDPTGDVALKQLVKYWTLEERNFQALPMTGWVLWNRLFWLFCSIIVSLWTYQLFHFHQFVAERRKKKEEEPKVSILRKVPTIVLPEVSYDFSFRQKLRTMWALSMADFRFIILSWPFVTILLSGLVMVYVQQVEMNPAHGVELLPTTARMLRIPLFIFTLVIHFLTFLYLGMLIYRKHATRMQSFIDIAPQPNWVLSLSRFLAITKMQVVLLTVIMIGGMLAQIVKGYYQLEVWHYLFELFGLQLIHFMIWAALAMLVHTLFNNLYLSLFLLLLCPAAVTGLNQLGLLLEWEWLQAGIFAFNQVPGVVVGFDYSDLYGYASGLSIYGIYKLYWAVLASLFIGVSVLSWKRGFWYSWQERWLIARQKLTIGVAKFFAFGGFLFVTLGVFIFYQEQVVSPVHFSSSEEEAILAKNELQYGHLEHLLQPKIAKAAIQMDIYPEQRDFSASGTLYFVNKTSSVIDTILVTTSFKEQTEVSIRNAHQLLVQDEEVRLVVAQLSAGLQLGDTLFLDFTVKNYPNNWLHDNSRVLKNGTYLQSNILPRLGLRSVFLTGKEKRQKYGLPERSTSEHLPGDTTRLGYHFSGNNMDRIEYETIVSTSRDQAAFSMGDLQREWVQEERRYFHFKSNGKITNNISWLSGNYESRYDSIPGLQLEVHHHADHVHNIDHILNGSKASLQYCSGWFGPLAHTNLKVVEFPLTLGTYATLNGNLIPYSESQLICDVHHHKNDVFNPPFYSAAHEVAHYWWGHRVDPANVQGGKLLTESIAEYIAFQVVKQQYGNEMLFDLRKKYRKSYLEIRARAGNELPLAFAKLDQDYLNYQKGAMAFYAVSQYWGSDALNQVLSNYEAANRFALPPYPTSLDFLDTLVNAMPDSIQYLVEDWFETITFYENTLHDVEISPNPSGQYELKVDISIEKFRTDAAGKRLMTSSKEPALSQDDYIQLGFYQTDKSSGKSTLIESRLVRVNEVRGEYRLLLDDQPDRVVIDPEQLLIEVDIEDNDWEE